MIDEAILKALAKEALLIRRFHKQIVHAKSKEEAEQARWSKNIEIAALMATANQISKADAQHLLS